MFNQPHFGCVVNLCWFDFPTSTSLFSGWNNCVFVLETSPTQLPWWYQCRTSSSPRQAVDMRFKLGSSNHLRRIHLLSRSTKRSEMLEPTLPASKESSCEFLLPRFPLSCFRPVSSKTWFFSFSFHFSTAFLCGWVWSAAAKSLQSCPTLCDPIDSSPPGYPVPGILRQEHRSGLPFPSPMHESEKWKCFSIHGIFQARVLEWGAVAFSLLFSTQEPRLTLRRRWDGSLS